MADPGVTLQDSAIPIRPFVFTYPPVQPLEWEWPLLPTAVPTTLEEAREQVEVVAIWIKRGSVLGMPSQKLRKLREYQYNLSQSISAHQSSGMELDVQKPIRKLTAHLDHDTRYRDRDAADSGCH